jgi:hypothetical protein
MPVQLPRKAPKLLSIVGGKPYATTEDHEEQLQYICEGEEVNSTMPRHWESEDDINADPISSGDEAAEPVKQRSPTPPPPVDATIAKPARSRTLEFPQSSAKRKSTRNVAPRIPRSGSFARNQEVKEKRKGQNDGVGDKENAELELSAQPGNSKRGAETEDDGPQWGMEHTRNKKTKTYANIHTLPSGQVGSGGKKISNSGTPRGALDLKCICRLDNGMLTMSRECCIL